MLPSSAAAAPRREACAAADPQRSAFFGDLHVHTQHSMDARSRDMLGSPDDAYRFARGETIGLGPFDAEGRGQRQARLERPLDFAAVTDHAEWIGEVNVCTTPGSPAYDSDSCKGYRGATKARPLIPGLEFTARMTAIFGLFGRRAEVCGPDSLWCREALETAWQSIQAATERWNDTSAACRFTTFHGWEHSNSSNQSKIHRNVVFRTASVPELPISSLEAPDAGELWDRLDALCTDAGTGCEAITIPHNPNVSNGRLFEATWEGEGLEEQRRRARQRARLGRLVEIMQVKGESECRNGMWGVVGGEDELCDFEKIRGLGERAPEDCDDGIGSGALRGSGCQSRLDFSRYALGEGLRHEQALGVNPFRFGVIGSTDTHNATPGDVEEYSYVGCCADTDAPLEKRMSLTPGFAGAGWVMRNPGGLMGAWAEENSRESLFAAMQRRETFATSGPRIQPRLFAGWDLPADLCGREDLVERGYAEGVPMGGVLEPGSGADGAPAFVATALRDPGVPDYPGGKLDRLQIVKVWNAGDGRMHQSVHDVAGRRATPEGGEAPTVDLASCEPRGEGADSLCATPSTIRRRLRSTTRGWSRIRAAAGAGANA